MHGRTGKPPRCKSGTECCKGVKRSRLVAEAVAVWSRKQRLNSRWNRREVLKGLVAASTALMVPASRTEVKESAVSSAEALEIRITPVSSNAFRVSLLSIEGEAVASIPSDGSLVKESWGTPTAIFRSGSGRAAKISDVPCRVALEPASITATSQHGQPVQRFVWDEKDKVLSFLIGDSHLLGLGQGGQQFDRRGSTDPMRNGQGGYKLATHGAR